MKWIKQTLFALLCIGIMVSCEYEFIEVATPVPPDPNDTTFDTVSFAGVIEPIFETSTCTNCHNGGAAFDLTAGNAYTNLFNYNDDVVVPGDPEASTIYTYPHPVTGDHGTKYQTADDANLVYSWIIQGALDN